MAQMGIRSNVYLGYLNLLPIPPLDGGRALLALLPNAPATLIHKIEPLGLLLVLLVVVTAALQQFGIGLFLKPANDAAYFLLNTVIPATARGQ